MTYPDSKTAPSAAEPSAALSVPKNSKTIFLGGLFALALLAAANVAGEIVLPLVFAFMLKLLLQPLFRILERLQFPKVLAALLLIIVLFGTVVGLGTAISGPAGSWAAKLPQGIARLEERLSFMQAPIKTFERFLQQIDNIGSTGVQKDQAGPFAGIALLATIFAGTRSFASGLFTTVLFLYFLLASGDTFLRRLVEILPGFGEKRMAVAIFATDRERCLRLSCHGYDHERCGRRRYCAGYVGNGSRRPNSLGNSRLPAELRAGPRPCFGRYDLSAGWLTGDRHSLAGASSSNALPGNSFGRGRDGNADASRETIHPQSSSRHSVAGLLVLDVGYRRCDSVRADAGHLQDHVRPHSQLRRAWPFS